MTALLLAAALSIGDAAPSIELTTTADNEVNLSEVTVVAFFPAAFTGG